MVSLTDQEQAEVNVPVEHLPYAKELVTDSPYNESILRTKVAQAMGYASGCWENLAGAGVFESTKAKEACDQLVADIIELTGMGQPQLGLATNAEIAAEVESRFAGGNFGPEYRSADA